MSKPRPESAGFELQVTTGEESFAWTTESVNQLLLALEEGYKPKSTPFYEGNPNLRKGNIVFNYTPEELREIKKCATDIVYFANNYCTVMTDEGLQTIILRDYQENMLRQFQKERFNVCLASRQIGKTMSSSSATDGAKVYSPSPKTGKALSLLKNLTTRSSEVKLTT